MKRDNFVFRAGMELQNELTAVASCLDENNESHSLGRGICSCVHQYERECVWRDDQKW